MADDEVLTALKQQLDCYQRLFKLARTQHEHVQNCRSEELMTVLSQRQELIDETANLEKITGPAKRDWPQYAAKLSAEQRAEAESLVGRIRSLMAEIVAADRDDTLVLQQRMLTTGRAINQASAARKFNQAYAKAAYGTKKREKGSICTADMNSTANMQSTAGAQSANAARIEELGAIMRQYSDLTEKLQQSHSQLESQVESLRNELSEKNRQLERRKRLAALGEMAAGMAHEIRNPLGGIELYASMLARDVAQAPATLQLVNKISAGVKRLEGLVSQVLQFSRDIQPQRVAVDLAGLVDEAVEMAGERLHQDIECKLKGARPLLVWADPLLMGQAILNLVLNAIEAVGDAGRIDITWSGDRKRNGFRISVRDDGTGIPAPMLEKIFNPFFTTKESGTGLGLAIVHRIVEAHEGTITAGNSSDGGAIFEIRIHEPDNREK